MHEYIVILNHMHVYIVILYHVQNYIQYVLIFDARTKLRGSGGVVINALAIIYI